MPRCRSPSISARADLHCVGGQARRNAGLGVHHLIDYRTEDFETRTREITGGRGVELILDAVGGELWKKGYRVLAPTGRLGMFGVSSLASGKERNLLSLLSMLANTPWSSVVQPATRAQNITVLIRLGDEHAIGDTAFRVEPLA